MTKNEIVLKLMDVGIDASYTDRSASVFIEDYTELSAIPGWFAFRIVCENGETEESVASVLSKSYNIRRDGEIWRLKSRGGIRIIGSRREQAPPEPVFYRVNAKINGLGYVTGGGVYQEGTVATLTAIPFEGCYFSHWSDGTANPVKTITVTGDVTLIAFFVEIINP